MRTALITGATGAIGSALAKALLTEPGTRLRLLVRARSAPHLQERLAALWTFWGLDSRDQSLAARVEAVAGDVTLPRLGLDPEIYGRLTREVTHIFHCAGNVKLNRPLDEARRSAVDATSHVITFVGQCADTGRFQKLEFASTVGVAGRMSGLVPERPLPDVHSFRNTYEAAKAEAEALMLSHIQNGMPATIHRPSMVVGNSVDGTIIQFQVFYHLCEFLSGSRTYGLIPETGDARLDIIPVDYVVHAMTTSSARPEAIGRIFHLCSGPSWAPRIRDLASHVHALFVRRRARLALLRRVPLPVVRASIAAAERVSWGRVRRSLQTLPYFLAYLDEPQTFANAETMDFFSQFGLTVPTVESYLEVILMRYLSAQVTMVPSTVS